MRKFMGIVTKLFLAILAVGLGSIQSAQAWVVYNQTSGSQSICASRGHGLLTQTYSVNPTYSCTDCSATKIYVWDTTNNTDQECGLVWTFAGSASCKTATEVQPRGYVIVKGTASNCEATVYPPDAPKPKL